MHLAPFSQIRENAGTVVALLAPSNDDKLWEEVKRAQGEAHQIGCYLDVELHTHVRGLVDRADGDVVVGVSPFEARALEDGALGVLGVLGVLDVWRVHGHLFTCL